MRHDCLLTTAMADNNEIDGHFLISPNKSTVFYNILELNSWYVKKIKAALIVGPKISAYPKTIVNIVNKTGINWK